MPISKVYIAIPCLYRGGTEIQTFNLARTLVAYGQSVTVVCYFEYKREVVKEFEKEGINVELMNLERSINLFKLFYLLYKFLDANKPDIIHIQYMSPGALPIIAARLAGVGTIYATVHQPWTPSHGLFSKVILKASSRLCTRFIAVSSNAEKSWFGTSYLFDENKQLKLQPRHLTIHNSVDTGKIQDITPEAGTNTLLQTLPFTGTQTIVGAVSRLSHEKGIDLLIEAFNILVKSGSKIHLLLVGSGPDELKLKNKVAALAISESVTFYGEADWDRTIRLMSIMDIVVVPSRFEGFGLTAAEAMAAGKPVVASDTTGLTEVAQQAVILFPVGDIEALKTALEKLINDPDLRKHYGNAGRVRVNKHFSLEQYSKKIKALYSI